jgi:hypothetical protein
MALNVKTLIPAVISYVTGKGGSVSKTKLLKLLYLFDIEYYRHHRKLFTGFDWKFFHLGPWTRELDTELNDLLQHGILIERPYETAEFEAMLLRTEEPIEIRDALSDPSDASLLQRVLNDWGQKSTGEILDHVYFRTEPMEHGVRNERLDFSWVSDDQPELYRRRSSETSPGLIARKKREYLQRLAELPHPSHRDVRITEPRYDEEYFEALDVMERMRRP